MKLIIVDDHPLFRGALSQALNASVDGARIDEAQSLDELTALLSKDDDIDLVLLDLAMPGVLGLSGLLFIRAQYPAIPVVVVSATEDRNVIRRCIEYGASGFVPKSQPVDRIRAAVQAVLNGKIWLPEDVDLHGSKSGENEDLLSRISTLTPQQLRVLMMLAEGLPNKLIAYKLGVSEATIKAHVSQILTKLGVDSRTQAVIAINKLDGVDSRAVLQPDSGAA
ncbi:MAG: response regulator transcription factor [Hyphomicrobiaceae bacterium]|nr:response regulator transcription factor [Hyphomicrobiaceae bacterium]